MDVAERLLSDHAILVKSCSDKTGMADRQFLRVTVRNAADNDYFLTALHRVMEDLVIDSTAVTDIRSVGEQR